MSFGTGVWVILLELRCTALFGLGLRNHMAKPHFWQRLFFSV